MELFEIVLLVLCALNILVSLLLLFRDDLEGIQKIAQIVIVWVIPFLGGIGLWLFHRSQDLPVKSSKGSFGGGPSDNTGGSAGDN
jgi:hypothetical protein